MFAYVTPTFVLILYPFRSMLFDMFKVAGYVRVSTEEQANAGVSLDAQESAIRAYCALRGLELAELVIDAGVSAGKPLASREGGRQLVDLVRKRSVQAVVAFKLDRLFRNAQDCLATTAQWDKLNVALHLLDLGGQSIDTSSTMGRFFLTIMAAAAEMERSLVRDRTKAAMQHKAAKGQRIGRVPYGKKLAADGIHLEQEPNELLAIQRIADMHKDGVSIRRIAARLNAESVKPRGSRWHKSTVQRILKQLA